jgi:PLP dependent protein
METLSQRYFQVVDRIRIDCEAAGRDPHTVHLLAVSKTRTAADVCALAALGQRNFAENYLQEALDKIHACADESLCWHFIGPIQSNKTRDIATSFNWVHSVDRGKIAQRLNDQRPAHLPPLNICIQVNIDGEESKSGVPLADGLADVAALAEHIVSLPRLQLRGLMAIPRADSDDNNRAAFDKLAMTLSSLRHTIAISDAAKPQLDTLSMGMSNDFDSAIAAGATHVRIGTALFGPRQ